MVCYKYAKLCCEHWNAYTWLGLNDQLKLRILLPVYLVGKTTNNVKVGKKNLESNVFQGNKKKSRNLRNENGNIYPLVSSDIETDAIYMPCEKYDLPYQLENRENPCANNQIL